MSDTGSRFEVFPRGADAEASIAEAQSEVVGSTSSVGRRVHDGRDRDDGNALLPRAPASRKGLGIAATGEGSRRIEVSLHLAGLGVGNHQLELDVAQRAVEQPEAVVEGVAVEGLGHQLEVALVEEPEV